MINFVLISKEILREFYVKIREFYVLKMRNNNRILHFIPQNSIDNFILLLRKTWVIISILPPRNNKIMIGVSVAECVEHLTLRKKIL